MFILLLQRWQWAPDPETLGKTYGTVMVGEEMMKAITYFELKGGDHVLPFLRASMFLDSTKWSLQACMADF